MESGVTYFLSSLDSVRFEPVRECRLEMPLEFNTGKTCALVRLNPPVSGQDFNIGGDIEDIVLAARHEEGTLFPITEFPCFVYIARPRKGSIDGSRTITKDDLEIIGWGELYRSRSDAEGHVFG
jgi:hypothetical protein